ncbi:GntR family transcriptional regulator [Micromonospora globispora]|uniref:GntR family transcriptional regulator n=1 Tax=Micromonospora globispora TaxID=1450148 RepID=A0A317K5P1_9ACTN|nr:GntR family transcriptional regulator [Micromonospora globispora]PWU48531.1 GntR family transcriptional regulator [Micromonospora globispora]PWU55162.1 GntR family transcriptional regulator [Micromonospora globispora]RQW99813.1 GntR family transcriptional regulator [Micromonospora globispora]
MGERATVTGEAVRIVGPPSMSQLAADAVRKMILSGRLQPGDRVVENQLTHQLGVSRPPLREALRVLEQEGLIVQQPRRGAIVVPITLHDVYEIFSLRDQLERMAVELGVPVRVPARLERCRTALRELEEAARAGDAATVTDRAFDFHLAVVGLAGHRRLEDAYRSLSLQMRLCMAMNQRARVPDEGLWGNVERHRTILEALERGDRQEVVELLADHGQHTFILELGPSLDGRSPEAEAWLDQLARSRTAPQDRRSRS